MDLDKKKIFLESADILKILKNLPHRYPFLLVDRIIDIDGDDSAIGIKNVTINEPHFSGHFPEDPIMPGVLLIEAMAQTAGAISLFQKSILNQTSRVYFMKIDKAKFRKPVIPGDQVHIHVKKLINRASISVYECFATVDGEKVAEAEISARVNVNQKN